MRVTEAGMAAVGAASADAAVVDEAADDAGQAAPVTLPADAAQKPDSAPLAPATASDALVPPTGAEAAQQPAKVALARPSPRDAAHRVLAAWDDGAGGRTDLPDAITALRAILLKPAPALRPAGPRKAREGTK